jgi:hypothetical protein
MLSTWNLYERYGIVNSTPGSVPEDEIRAKIVYIEQCSDTKDGKLDLLEVLDVYAQNNLEYGMSSPVIAEIREAWNRVFYS